MPGYNKFWHPYDEGFMLEGAHMINLGMMPYRDFFLLLYPPAQLYALALFFKIFGAYFLVARIYTIVTQTLICFLVFYIGRKVASAWHAFLGTILCLAVIPSYGRPIAVPTWPAIALSLSSILFMLKFIEKGKTSSLFWSSFFAGLTFVFRHDTGFWTTLPGLIAILLIPIHKVSQDKISVRAALTESGRSILAYLSFPVIFITFLVFFLYDNHALKDALVSLFIFPSEYIARADIPFPEFCFNPIMIFHRGSLFIKNNQYYVPILICAAGALMIIIKVISNRRLDKNSISLITVLSLAIFYLQQIIIRTDIPHLASALPPSAILFAAILGIATDGNLLYKKIRLGVLVLVSSFIGLLIYIATESYIKETYVKAFIKKTIEPVTFDRGTLYLPDDGRDTVVSLVDYVKNHTTKEDMIYVGNTDHSVNEFNQYHVLYFLSNRLPGVKYYELSAGLQNRPEIQKEMIESLKRNKVKMIILRSYGKDSTAPGPLDRFIRENYKLRKVIDTCYIYVL